ncbi:hypothetical protein [Lysobacter sp. FW306-1B-D06B]|uniref:hypothetical protein n=1 Tax=Lysobacter sp. FW306-1B-D06B TaxID=3140250 RepID=UPI0031407F77
MNRFIEIARARTRLERYGWPRLQMSVIVLVTGAAGLLASFLLLAGGLESMLLRYPLAVLIAYGVFLVQMAVWTRWGSDASDTLDLTDLPTGRTGGGGWSGSGGHSGGGGASASWGPSSGAGSSSSSSGVDLLDGVDGDGLPLLVPIALVAVVCVIAAGWVVWTAPALMAELMVDAAIAGGLYKRMRGTQSEGWWWLCVRHTFWPLLGVLLFFVALGVAAKVYAPQATTLMQALQAL